MKFVTESLKIQEYKRERFTFNKILNLNCSGLGNLSNATVPTQSVPSHASCQTPPS